MTRSLKGVLAELPAARRRHIAARAADLASLHDLRIAAQKTQQELAASLGVGQDTISRLERRSDLLLSTLRRFVEATGGSLELVARYPGRPPVRIDRLGALPDPVTARSGSQAHRVHEPRASYRVAKGKSR